MIGAEVDVPIQGPESSRRSMKRKKKKKGSKKKVAESAAIQMRQAIDDGSLKLEDLVADQEQAYVNEHHTEI